MPSVQRRAKDSNESGKKLKGFTDEEKDAMKERIRELKAGSRHEGADAEREVLAKISGMPEPDRTIGKRLHAVVKASAPGISFRLWYGMPAYTKDGKVVCFFQPAHKFKTRYATLGFSDEANLDEGKMWPTVFALKDLTGSEEARISSLVKRAVG
ncbi:MAG TPA: DUF1801 domain-containing protein [Nitrososphaerales archaeon]|nr:DUF1801 domain-containing protein [Nitrososphaerales archaeon]